MAIDATVGDGTFHLAPGQRSARTVVHVDAGGNTGVSVHRSDASDCGAGDVKYLQPGHSYTVTITDGGTCVHAGKSEPVPTTSLSSP